MKINIKKVNEDAIIPTKGSDYAAGYDLYATKDEVIFPHNTTKVSTGLAIEIPEGYFGGIFARSGLASKKRVRPANCVGVIDSDYRGEIIVLLHNDSERHQFISKGDRIAQLIVLPYLSIEFEEVENLNETERGEGGFGSTGK
ncbi:MAG TPA: dUTP diphosphatase [Erysipelotrichaceae bacterium]|jgi:dUTP pyrophosphatase|nr:dUTP diphosphatase [Erysipelotrichia bacterium]HPX32304.1 dUTP diphosphatase [Erysipelotrichaceae bacterium]HQA84815.1 dUTP diphosphatase [Erysipelotrichaceae bacterium]